ncbi:hypothetical protein [Sphingomonas sp. URHD0057]|uniref:hypothetical protein n=1 Tax=Sphingomonas sp. URHD0057 TaxID=1380389 RepID=UPI00048B2D2B|nr:hypothetical protein [Sphingomonas sp. URHD0057]
MATAAAAILARARREVDQLFFDNDAFSRDRAVEFEPRLPVQKRYLEQLIAQGVVQESEPGRYWLDLGVYRERRRERSVWTFWIMVLFAIILAVVWGVKTFIR